MNNAARRYAISCSILMIVYVVLVAMISWIIDLQSLPYAVRVLAAAAPGVPLLATLFVFDRYLRSEPDEFLRFLQTRAALLAGGVVVGLLSAWGFLEQYAGWPRFPSIMAYPAFWAAFGVASMLVRRRYA